MGKCKACGERLDFAKKGQVVDEHIIPLFSGGTNDTENRALLCKPCATDKTSAEAPDRAKVRRIEGKKTQADRRTRAKAEGRYKPIPSRGFSKQHRPMGRREK
jgi:5-methylcytosine-specific restriction endonuclease McrA